MSFQINFKKILKNNLAKKLYLLDLSILNFFRLEISISGILYKFAFKHLNLSNFFEINLEINYFIKYTNKVKFFQK